VGHRKNALVLGAPVLAYFPRLNTIFQAELCFWSSSDNPGPRKKFPTMEQKSPTSVYMGLAKGVFMSFRQQLASELPYLRRYARALTGSQTMGDAAVRETLEALLGYGTAI
jgi:hypothetical protein